MDRTPFAFIHHEKLADRIICSAAAVRSPQQLRRRAVKLFSVFTTGHSPSFHLVYDWSAVVTENDVDGGTRRAAANGDQLESAEPGGAVLRLRLELHDGQLHAFHHRHVVLSRSA